MSGIVLGTVAIDNIKTSTGDHSGLLGGSAAHFSMSARFFAPIHIAGIIGQNFPEAHLDFLKSHDVDLSAVVIGDGPSFEWHGEYHDDDLNSAITLETELGVLADYHPVITEDQKHIQHVFLANSDPDVQTSFLNLFDRPRLVGLDSMNLWITNKRDSLVNLMKRVNLFVANDGEAKMLTGETNLIRAAKALRAMGPEMIVVKKGEHGVLYYCDDYMFSFPAFPVEDVIDPTGAGDTFAGALMGYLSQQDRWDIHSMKTAILYATVLSSYNVEAFGMRKTGGLNHDDVRARMDAFMEFSALPELDLIED
jgi:sugar/nucleoside kinase (ribokinase family)